MRMDDLGVGSSCKLSNAGYYRSVDLPLTRDQMRFNAFPDGRLVKLQIRVCRVRKNAKYARMRPLIQGARQVQDDSLCPIHPAATDDVQNFHWQQLLSYRYLSLCDSEEPKLFRTAGLPTATSRRLSSDIAAPGRIEGCCRGEEV